MSDEEGTPSGPIENAPAPEAPEPERKKKETWLTMPLAVVIAGVFIAGAIVLAKTPAPSNAAAVAGANSSITVGGTLRAPSSSDHIIGNPNAPVVIVEFADFQCPYCSLIYPSLKRIVDDSNGQVAWVFRNFPLDSIHPEARPAAEAAECIAGELGNSAYWQFVEDDYTNQSAIGDAWYTAEAQKLGANLAQFNQCVTSKKYDSRINTDEAEAVENGGQGTPFTVVVSKSGKAIPFSGALPYSEINAIVQSLEPASMTGK